jgi:hypothetical protein
MKASPALRISPVPAGAAGYTAAAINRSFGLSRTSLTRIVRTGNEAKQLG